MRLIDAPVGLFMSKEGEMCLKTEYIADWGVEAYIVSSGETFWGGAKTAEERNNLDVTPVDAVPVVRCKDCKHYHADIGWCDEHSHFIDADRAFCHPWESTEWKMFEPDYFCADGERKDGDTDGS